MKRRFTLRKEHLAELTAPDLEQVGVGAMQTTTCPYTVQVKECLTALTCHPGCTEQTQTCP